MKARALFRAIPSVGFVAVLLTGCGGGSNAEATSGQQSLERRLQDYHSFLSENAKDLTSWVAKVRGQIAADDLPKAGSRYATARVQLGQIDPAIPAGALHGETRFRRVEKALFGEETTNGVKRTSAQLLAEVEELQRKIERAELRPPRIAAAAAQTVQLVSTKGVEGKFEPFSHIDFVDIAARIEGAQEAFKAIEPLVDDRDLKDAIDKQFRVVYEVLNPYGAAARIPQSRPAAAGARFVNYSEISAVKRRRLEQPIHMLLRLLEETRDSLGG